MLEPRDRRLLLDALRPPSGFRLDRAIGTTYSLDLLALLTVPLAFTFLDWEDDEGRPTADPLALLEASRRHAERITIFCDAGRIVVPPVRQPLLGYVEQCVVEVSAPDPEGVFHPKVWAIRFRSEDGLVRYRLLSLSRNLTFDRSWDTALVLDGELVERSNAFRRNHPLGDFLETLPQLARRGIHREVERNVREMSEEIRRVAFEPPEGVEDVAFWPLGIQHYRRLPFPGPGRRMLIVSPFVSEGLLARMAEDHPGSLLVSRAESLGAISPETLNAFDRVWVLSGDLETDGDEETCDAAALSGLHAKLFVEDDGWDARIWTGSANATEAAFRRNVEFLVELFGRKSRLGVDAVLGETDALGSGLLDLLQEFQAPDSPPEPASPLEGKLEAIQRELARVALRAEVASGEGEVFELRVAPDGPMPHWPNDVHVTCRPVTLRSEQAQRAERGSTAPISFPHVSFEAITSFFVFEVSGSEGGAKGSVEFTVNLPLAGAPVDRRERLLRSLLRDRDQVLRLLLLLLAEEELSVADLAEASQAILRTGSGAPSDMELLPLLEPLLRALARDPRRLDPVARLVEDLRRSPEGAALLPEGLEQIWSPIAAARERENA